MHRRQFLESIVGVILLVSAAQAATTTDIYSDYSKKVISLKENLKKEKSVAKRHELLEKTLAEVEKLRAASVRQDESKEIEIGLFADTLAYVPPRPAFKDKDCRAYEKQAARMMKDPSEAKQEPGVQNGLEVLSLLCR